MARHPRHPALKLSHDSQYLIYDKEMGCMKPFKKSQKG
jgi:hypothetical protein